jgi:hypothetical protein
MSPEDPVRPYHAKDKAHGQEAADAVAAVLKHAAERDERARAKQQPKRHPKWMLPVGIQLAVLAVYLLISPPRWITVRPIQGPNPAAQEQGLRVAMYLQSQQIEAYRDQHGRLPNTLADLPGTPQPGVEYEVQSADEYRLVGTNGAAALIYDSTQSAADFLGRAAAAKLASGAGGRS